MDTLHEDQHTFSFISRSFLLRMRTVCDKICRENQHTHLTFRFFFRKSCLLCDKVEKHCSAWQTADDNMAHVHFALGT